MCLRVSAVSRDRETCVEPEKFVLLKKQIYVHHLDPKQ